MKISARNQFHGVVTSVTPGAVNGAVKVEIGGGAILTSSITAVAIAEERDSVTLIIKASDVLIGK